MFHLWFVRELHLQDHVFFIRSALSECGKSIPVNSRGTVEQINERDVVIRLDESLSVLVHLNDAMGPHRRVNNSVACIVIEERDGYKYPVHTMQPTHVPKRTGRDAHIHFDGTGPHSWNAPDGAANALATDGRHRESVFSL